MGVKGDNAIKRMFGQIGKGVDCQAKEFRISTLGSSKIHILQGGRKPKGLVPGNPSLWVSKESKWPLVLPVCNIASHVIEFC